MKVLKFLKYILFTWLALTLLIGIVVVIKYNLDLNSYIDQEEISVEIDRKESLGKETEVYVVGTLHFENNSVKRDDFFRYISSISPNIILYETANINRVLNRTNFFNQLNIVLKGKNKIESFIVHRYLKYHPETKVFGYEWKDRDEFHFKHSYASTSSEMIGSLIQLYNQNQLNEAEVKILKEYLTLNNSLNKISSSGSVDEINSLETDSIAFHRQNYMYNFLPTIIKEKNELEKYHSFADVHMGYWDKRNQEMVSNIIEHIKLHPNKRLLILTGFFHRYYLIDELKKQEKKLNFKLKFKNKDA